jgi:hypothetical protein
MPQLVDPPLALTAITDGSPEENRPLPPVQGGPGRIDWNVAASTTATASDAASGTGLPLAPRPVPTKLQPPPTATSRSAPWSATGTNSRPRNSHNDRHGNLYNSAEVFTSGSPAFSREFMVDKLALALSVIYILVGP